MKNDLGAPKGGSAVTGRLLRGLITIAVALSAVSAGACSGLRYTVSRASSVTPSSGSNGLPPLTSLGEKPSSRGPAGSALPGPPTSGISTVKFSPNGKMLAVTRVSHGRFRLLLISLHGKIIQDIGNIPDDDFEWDSGGKTIYYLVPPPVGTRAARAKAFGLGAVTLTGKRFTMFKPEEQSYFLGPVPGGGISFLVQGTVKESSAVKSTPYDVGPMGMAIWAWVPGHPAHALTPAEHLIPPWAISSGSRIAFVETAHSFPVGELHVYEHGQDRVVVPISKARFMGGYGLGWRGTTGIYCVWVVWVPGLKTQYTPAEFGGSSQTGTLGWIDVATGKLHWIAAVEKAREPSGLHPGPIRDRRVDPDVILRMVRWNKSGGALVMVGSDSYRSLKVMTPDGAFREIASGPWVGSAGWSPDGRQAAFEVDGSPGLWDKATGKVRWIKVTSR